MNPPPPPPPHLTQGHAQTVDKVLKWIDEEGGVEGVTVCDAGCGTGEAGWWAGCGRGGAAWLRDMAVGCMRQSMQAAINA